MEITKDLFPLLKKQPNLIYLDSAATTLKPQVLIDKINEYYSEYGVNVNRGVYNLSQMATDALELSRFKMAEFINCKTEEVIFTKGTTDSINMVARMMDDVVKENDEIIVSVLDHHSFIIPFQELAKRKKAKLKYVALDDTFTITKENLNKVLNAKTKIVCLTYVSNVIGKIEPIKELIESIKAYNENIITIVDAAQAAPHLKIDVKNLNCEFLAFSLHKMLGATGVGILFGKEKLLNSLSPTQFGGDMNDGVDLYESTYKDAPHRFEAGTPNIEGIISVSATLDFLNLITMKKIEEHSKMLAQYALNELSKIKGVTVYNKCSDTGIVTFNIDGVHPHDTVTYLSVDNLCLRAGHHCAQLITKYLGVLGTVRASFYIYNTLDDAKALIEAVKKAVKYYEEW